MVKPVRHPFHFKSLSRKRREKGQGDGYKKAEKPSYLSIPMNP